MKTEAEWKNKEAELASLIEERSRISKRIHVLKVELKQHKEAQSNPPDKRNTIAFQMFGKRLKDLSKEEYRAYNNARQRINRQKRKSHKQST